MTDTVVDVQQINDFFSIEQLEKFEAALVGKDKLNYRGITVNKEKEAIQFVSTGVMTLDYCFGGGIPLGKIIEIYGQNSVGKSVIAGQLMKAIQKSGRLPALIDAERRFDPQFAQLCGVDLDKLAVQKPNSLEEALDYMRRTVNSGLFGLVVLDSVASLAPIEEIEKDMTENTIGKISKAYCRLFREIAATADNNQCSILLLNQLRANITSYGASSTTTGGNSIPYHCSVRMEVKRVKALDTDLNITSAVKVVKNSVSTPFKEGEITIMFPHQAEGGEIKAGIDEVSDVVNMAIKLGLINRSGAWFSYRKGEPGEVKTQGKEKMVRELALNPDLMDNVIADISSII